MAKYPISRSTGSLPGVSGAAPVNYNTDTGAGQVGRAIQGAGQTAFNVNSIVFRKQGVAELTKSMFEAEQKLNKTVMDFETNTDESTYQKKMDQTYAEIRQKEPENGWARQQYRQAMFNLKGKFNGIAQSAVAKRVNDKYEDSLSLWAAQAIQSGDTGVYELQLNKEVEEGRLTAERRDLMLAKVQPAADRKNKETQSNQATQLVMGIAEAEGLDAAIDALKQMRDEGEIPVDVYENARDRVARDYNFQIAQEKAQHEAAVESDRGLVNKAMFEDKSLTWEQIDGTNLDEKEKKSTWEGYVRWLKSGFEPDVKKRDQMALLYGRYTKNPTRETRAAAYKFYSENFNHLTESESTRYRTGLLENDPNADDKKVIVNELLDEIDARMTKSISLYEGNQRADGEDIDQDYENTYRDEALRDKAEFRRFVEENRGKNIPDDAYRAKFKSLMMPREDKVVLSWLEKVFNPVGQNHVLTLNRVKALKEMDAWDNFMSGDQARIKAEFEKGSSIYQTLQSLNLWNKLTEEQKKELE